MIPDVVSTALEVLGLLLLLVVLFALHWMLGVFVLGVLLLLAGWTIGSDPQPKQQQPQAATSYVAPEIRG